MKLKLDTTRENYPVDQQMIDYDVVMSNGITHRGPISIEDNPAVICFGAAQTFGRFVQHPYPSLLTQQLGVPVMNFGKGAMGPTWIRIKAGYEELVNSANVVVYQALSGRSMPNVFFDGHDSNPLVRANTRLVIANERHLRRVNRMKENKNVYTPDIDFNIGDVIPANFPVDTETAYEMLFADMKDDARNLFVESVKRSWVHHTRDALSMIKGRRVFLWFSRRPPEDGVPIPEKPQRDYPHFVDREMVNEVLDICDDYVEVVSTEGLPMELPTGRKQAYYPSPEMHALCADALEKSLRGLGVGR